MSLPGRQLPAHGRSGRGPLGALPRLSMAARRALVACAVLAALSAVALVAQAWALASMLAEVVSGGHGPLGARLALLAGAVLARALLGWATQVVAARAAVGAKEELRGALLDRALALGPEWIAARGPAELTVLATKGLDALDAYFATYLPALVTAAVVPIGIGGVVLFADWPSAIVIAATVPLIPLFAALVGLHTRDRVGAAARTTARLSGHLLEMVRALPVLTAFRRAQAQETAVRRVSDAHREASMATLRVAFSSAFVLELVATLSVALVAVGIGLRLVSGDLGLAVGLFVLILAPECYLPLRAAGAAHHASEDGLDAVCRVADIPARGEGFAEAASPLAELSVAALRVRRREGFAPDGLSFTVRPGEIVRLDSPSGSGKSTTFGVLLGFVPPESGAVLVNGRPLGAIDPASWRRALAWVPQRPAFTGGTMAEELEIAISDQDGGAPTREELRSVAAQAVADHLLDRPVAQLSTGERQRVAVARALLRVRRGARLLLLDEPTAHLDQASAGQVMTSVAAAAAGGVAVVLASHRTADAARNGVVAAEPVGTVDDESPGGRFRLRALVSRRVLLGAVLGAGGLVCGIALTATSAWLIAKASQHPPILTLSVAVVAVRTFGLARAGLRYAERLVTHDAAFRTATELRTGLWRALVRLGPARTLGLRRSEGLQRLVDDVDTVRDLTPRVLLPLLVAAGVCLAAVIVQWAILPAAALALAVAVLVAGFGAPALAVALDRRAGRVLADGRRLVAAGVLGLVDAAPDLIAVGADRVVRTWIGRIDAALAVRARRAAWGAGAAGALITLATGSAAMIGAWSAALAVAAGTLNPVLAPVLALVPLAVAEALSLLPPAAQHHELLRLSYTRVALLNGSDAGTGTSCPHPPSCPQPPPLLITERPPTDRMVVGSPPGIGWGLNFTSSASVALNGVDVRWPGAAEPALREVDLRLPHGAHVAVVGPSGAGKSTLLALLLGFLPAERGTAAIPTSVAWCPQEPQLVSTTVRENLRLGDPGADDDTLADALHRAGIGHWAHRLDTPLGAGASAASGGEAQRLALARAVLAARDADLVLLDEPTAHLDVPTARTVLRRLRHTLAGRTVVHVTHRPEEAVNADLVIEIVGGRLRVHTLAA